MANTYDPTLPTDKDWVRNLIGDRGPTTWVFSDEEIQAMIAESVALYGEGPWTKYLVSCQAGKTAIAQGGDVIMKQVGDLKIQYGGDDPDSSYQAYLKTLCEKGSGLLLRNSGSHIIRML